MKPTKRSVSPEQGRRARVALLLHAGMLVLMALGCGCRLLHETARLPGRTVRSVTGKGKQTGTFDPVILQQRLMRFADDYTGRMTAAIDSLPVPTNSSDVITLFKVRLDCVDGTLAVATGPNELMNLADMFVLVTLTRTIVEEQWLPGVSGESAQRLLAASQIGQSNITAIALTVVSPQQLSELRSSIAEWRREHPDLRSALFARGLGFEVELVARQQRQNKVVPGSVFSLLGLDPLAGLDPAARELAQTRLFAERALFLGQRMPTLLRWQGELFVLETAETPPMRELRSNTSMAAGALERARRAGERLPAQVRAEREALLKALPGQGAALANLATQLTATLEAGTRMSKSLNTTLNTVRGLQEGEAARAATHGDGTQAAPKPFRIENYTEGAKQAALAAQQLTELLRTLNQTLDPTNLTRLSNQVSPMVQQAQEGGRVVVKYAFRKTILLLGVACGLALVTVLVFRWVRTRTPTP